MEHFQTSDNAVEVSDDLFFRYCEITPNTDASNRNIWLSPSDYRQYQMSSSFAALLEDYSLALTPRSTFNTFARPRVDAVLHHTLALTKISTEKNANMYSYPPFNLENIPDILTQVSWAYDQHILLPDTIVRKGNIMECMADYILWYGEKSDLETMLIVMRAERPIDKYQYLSSLAAMSLIQHNRKKSDFNQETFGIITDGFEWVFIHLNNKKECSSISLNWTKDQPEAIIAQLAKILNTAITPRLLSGFKSSWIPPFLNRVEASRVSAVHDTDSDGEYHSDYNTSWESDEEEEENNPPGFRIIKMEWLSKLEDKVNRLTKRFKGAELEEEIDKAFQLVRTASAEDNKSSSQIRQAREPKLPSLAVSNIPAQDVTKAFGLKFDKNPGDLWVLQHHERRPLTDYLRSILADYELALGDSNQNEAFIRARVDAVLLSTLAQKKRQEFGQHGQGKGKGKRTSGTSVESFKSLHWQFERPMTLKLKYDNKLYQINGITDYSLWYGDPRTPESNLVVVETRKRGVDGSYQCFSYLGMLRQIRKRRGKMDTSLYGIATDSWIWTFIRVDTRGKISTHTLSWLEGKGPDIISHLHKIMDHAAILSAAPSQTPSRQPTEY
ncbi:hypothetical protein BDV28DRAFT_146107 [Aspergillus coremiiformis]|uniref:Uncharacterized protein n=1 Tax=Aspergillus coremiiformis TaxID=138285 RepID=A0A5N6ZE18_9EURO|nr:hypothetical protein BDV28DRAFT_146107 [Aspergillus coremiiformis]